MLFSKLFLVIIFTSSDYIYFKFATTSIFRAANMIATVEA